MAGMVRDTGPGATAREAGRGRGGGPGRHRHGRLGRRRAGTGVAGQHDQPGRAERPARASPQTRTGHRERAAPAPSRRRAAGGGPPRDGPCGDRACDDRTGTTQAETTRAAAGHGGHAVARPPGSRVRGGPPPSTGVPGHSPDPAEPVPTGQRRAARPRPGRPARAAGRTPAPGQCRRGRWPRHPLGMTVLPAASIRSVTSRPLDGVQHDQGVDRARASAGRCPTRTRCRPRRAPSQVPGLAVHVVGDVGEREVIAPACTRPAVTRDVMLLQRRLDDPDQRLALGRGQLVVEDLQPQRLVRPHARPRCRRARRCTIRLLDSTGVDEGDAPDPAHGHRVLAVREPARTARRCHS